MTALPSSTPPRYFVGIGGQKCGTTWLASYLRNHPQVAPMPIKEMHVFDQLFVPQLAKDSKAATLRKIEKLRAKEQEPATSRDADSTERYGADIWRALVQQQREAHEELLDILTTETPADLKRAYADYFARRAAPAHRCFGEVTPAYALLPAEGYEMILDIYPTARFIFVMRDPVDRLWSRVRHELFYDPVLDPEAAFENLLDSERSLARTRYESTLTTLGTAVPSDQVLVLFYEDMFGADGRDALRRITDFLELDFVPGDRDNVQHRGRERTLPRDLAVIAARTFAPTYAFVEEQFGGLPDRWREQRALAR